MSREAEAKCQPRKKWRCEDEKENDAKRGSFFFCGTRFSLGRRAVSCVRERKRAASTNHKNKDQRESDDDENANPIDGSSGMTFSTDCTCDEALRRFCSGCCFGIMTREVGGTRRTNMQNDVTTFLLAQQPTTMTQNYPSQKQRSSTTAWHQPGSEAMLPEHSFFLFTHLAQATFLNTSSVYE